MVNRSSNGIIISSPVNRNIIAGAYYCSVPATVLSYCSGGLGGVVACSKT